MPEYIKLRDLASHLQLNRGDRVYVTSDVKGLLYEAMHHDDETDLNILIDGIKDIIGEEGSLVFPTFNWSFCGGTPFDIRKTAAKTGSLCKVAMERSDFRRTKHPIYSFAAWGKDTDDLCAMENKSSFGADSPFAYMVEHGYRNLFIDKDLEHSFVFVHFAEQSVGNLHKSYRYLKDFTGEYTDENGVTTVRTYDMNVRALDRDVTNVIYAFEDEFIEKGIMKRFFINGLEFKIIELKDSHPILQEDVRHNRSRRICSYIGQEDPYLEDGKEMFDLAREMFPICRSIMGDGVRKTFDILRRRMPDMKLFEVPTGTRVFDWTVPNEWNIREAYIENENGERIIDMKVNNLHVMGYSVPVDEWMDLAALKEHIYTLKGQPDLIPYCTSYYKERWGFCMSQNMLDLLPEGKYHAYIDSTLEPGSLTYGELLIPGKSSEEIFFSSYICHPSMANNECSGPVVMTKLAEYIMGMKDRRYSYRLVLLPETIGAITYISTHLEEMKKNIIAGFNITCVGDDRAYSIVHSKYADTLADKVLMNVLADQDPDFCEYSYLERGSDERQYQAPGVDIPLVCFCRSKYHVYPEYHTSGDNLDIISPDGLAGSYEVLIKCVKALENNRKYRIKCLCEPQLGRRGLMPTTSNKESYKDTLILKDICAYADGTNDIFELSDHIGHSVNDMLPSIEKMVEAGILEDVERQDPS
ncbi:MAG: DUF4910 domain-containing protein [Lachnospiraceae bacterium]|nr:DUF4910 domain-containing protein [Lachnospiraceae bacterium]